MSLVWDRSWRDPGESDDEFDWNCVFEADAGESEQEADEDWSPDQEFVSMMIKLLLYSSISSITFCQIMYWAGRAGIKEAVRYGLEPGKQSGKYSQKIKKIFDYRAKKHLFYQMRVPGQGKHDIERSEQSIDVIPGYEQLLASVDAKTEQELVDLRAKTDGLPPQYWDHPIVQADPDEPIYPIAIYIDGVPYSHTDGVIGFWMINLITSMRFCIGVLRKRNLCKCGCRGWCTIYHFFRMLHWELKTLAEGIHPATKHDGTEWTESDNLRKDRAGTLLGIKAALMFLKGDWMEFAATFGFPSWSDAIRPCFLCNMYGTFMYLIESMTLDRFCTGFRANEEDDYFDACDRCEVLVQIVGYNNIQSLEQVLRYDRSKDGARGRVLTRDLAINGVSLRKNDRLEPSTDLPDVGQLIDLDSLPKTIVFWRRTLEDLTRHRNPIFDRSLGVTPTRSLSVGLLHAFYLGILNTWCKVTIWKLIMRGAYGWVGRMDESITIAVVAIRNALMNFYRDYQRRFPKSNLTRVNDFTTSMIGKRNDQKLKTKGAETWGVCLFLIEEIKVRGNVLDAEERMRLQQAGDHLEHIVRIWKTSNWTMDREQATQVMNHYKIYARLMRPFEIFTPKHHIMIHPIFDQLIKGNPWHYSEWIDESLNKTLRATCRHASQQCFEQTVLLRMLQLLNDPDHHRGTKRFHT
jgi:hypothetical protein